MSCKGIRTNLDLSYVRTVIFVLRLWILSRTVRVVGVRDRRLSVVVPVLRVLVVGSGACSGHGECAESGVGEGDRVRPGPVRVDLECGSAGVPHEPSGGGEDAQPAPFGFVERCGGRAARARPGARWPAR